MQFAKEFPDELRLQILASEVVGKKVALKKKGKEFGGLCPFHNEKTPSFTVNDQKGFYHCFGCGAHGDIITFTRNIEGLDFKEAVIKLANDHNIAVPVIKKENQPFEDQRLQQLERQYLLLQKIAEFFQKNLFEYQGQVALNYLQKRGLDLKNIKKFHLGFAPDSFDALHSHLTNLGFNRSEILTCGAVGENQNKKLFDKFRNRVIFPIFSKNNKIIAFGGRILGEGQPKYLNSSETNFFKKGSSLYNFNFARKVIFEEKFAVVVEGYMDVLSLDINGIHNSVAPLGTAITSDQLQGLFKITDDIVICLDGDAAGVKAMERVIEIALPLINGNKILRFAFLPAGSDPDDFVKQHGKNAALNLFKSAKTLSQTLFEFEAKNIGISDFNSHIAPEKKTALENKLLQKINLISDPNSKKYFNQYYKNLLFEIGKNRGTFSKKPTPKSSSISSTFTNPESSYAQSILALLIADPKLIDYQDDYFNIRELDFEDETLANIKESLIDFIDKNEDFNSHDLLDHLNHLSLIEQNLKTKVLISRKNPSNNEIKLRILALKYYHCQLSKQYLGFLAKIDNFETSNSSMKDGTGKELFDHKTELEKKILELESNLT